LDEEIGEYEYLRNERRFDGWKFGNGGVRVLGDDGVIAKARMEVRYGGAGREVWAS